MSEDVIRRYNSARPIQAPAQLLADAIREVEVLREENARLRAALKPFVKTLEWNCTDADPDDACIDHEGALSIGDLRKAAAAIREGGKDE